MSADNYIVVRKFGENDFRWGMFFASDDPQRKTRKHFKHGPFKTQEAAARNAEKEVDYIEYGITFDY